MNGAGWCSVIVVIAISGLAFLWHAAAQPKPKPQKHRPQIWCDDTRQRMDGNGGWPLCELKLREA